MTEDMQPIIYTRKCGHAYDAILFWYNPSTKMMEVVCVPCLVKAAGMKPTEILTPEEFAKRYMGLKK